MSALTEQLAVRRVAVQVAGVDEPVYVRELTVNDQLAALSGDDQEAVMLYLCCEDAGGERVFADPAAARAAPVIRVAKPLMDAINALNGWDEAQVQAAEGN